MKKILLWGLSVCLLLGGLGAAYFKLRPPQSRQSPPPKRYVIERIPNAQKTGDLVFVNFAHSFDDFHLFIWDAKSPRNKVVSLGEHRYSSTQGSDSEFWSKDRMMCAQYSESAEIFYHRSPWTIGYDWTTHRVLQPNQIVKAFKSNGGKGQQEYPKSRKTATPAEEKLFNLKARIKY